MLHLGRIATRSLELLIGSLFGLWRLVFRTLALNPRLGPFRYVSAAIMLYVAFAVCLVYVVAPIRGIVGNYYAGDRLAYDAERWLATALYDRSENFIGTYSARLDSQRDVNWTGAPIELGTYTANPDHKSIPVTTVPQQYWQCLTYHEDRYIGTLLNPAGIDLLGVLKIPYSSLRRSLALHRPALGVGGSTLPMQLARVIYKTPPSRREGSLAKLRRKFGEWWLAPVIYRHLTAGGDDTPLKMWAANHFWLAQRTGGQPLHGVEMAARIVFGKSSQDLTTAEQFVLASAVNKPIILLEGSERLNAVRLDHWRYITEVRAKACAQALIHDPAEKRKVVFELVSLANGPPDPKVRPRLQETLETYAPRLARRAAANPVTRAAALLPAARFGIREEMKQRFGVNWRQSVRGITTTLDVAANLSFETRIQTLLAQLDKRFQARLKPGFTLDPDRARNSGGTLATPNIAVVAADVHGRIVRYWEAGETAAYFGSPLARDPTTGRYDPAHEQRRIASTGKMMVAIALGNWSRDTPNTLYFDTIAPARGIETCAHGNGSTPAMRRAIVAFACSLGDPIEWRGARLGQPRIRRLIDGFGFAMPPTGASRSETPPSTAAAMGLVAGSPRRVHHMAAAILASMTGNGRRPLPAPTLIKSWHLSTRTPRTAPEPDGSFVPDKLITPRAVPFLKSVLSAPLCHEVAGRRQGTLKWLGGWCARRNPHVTFHFAKTGTDTNEDPNQTVDTWIAGGVRFATGQAYSYVVEIGTASTASPFAEHLNAGLLLSPLAETLLKDLEAVPRAAPRQSRRTAGLSHRTR
ncbi:MAG: transglycosylase domain-containing protein [Hyphomicrobiaceae bacterium]